LSVVLKVFFQRANVKEAERIFTTFTSFARFRLRTVIWFLIIFIII